MLKRCHTMHNIVLHDQFYPHDSAHFKFDRCLSLILLFAVAPFVVAQTDTIELSNGDRITGTIVETNEDGTVIENSVFGKVLIPHGHLISVVPTASDDVAAIAKAKAAENAASTARAAGADTRVKAQIIMLPEPDHVPSGLFGTNFLFGWEKSFELGLSGSSGNSENHNLHIGAQASYEDEKDRWNFTSAYFFSSDDGDASQNELFITLIRDWIIPESKWFYSAQSRFDWDEFQTWECRISSHAGFGYQFVQKDSLELNGRIGAGFSQELSPDECRREALAGLEGAWQITEQQKISGGMTIHPDLSDIREFRTLSHLEWIIAPENYESINLKLGMNHEYQSHVGADDDKDDVTYYLALVYKF